MATPNTLPMPSKTARGPRFIELDRNEENVGGKWEHLDISGEMLTGRAHHVIYFASAEHWQTYPEWVRQRHAEIIARIKSEFCAPDYEYHGDA